MQLCNFATFENWNYISRNFEDAISFHICLCFSQMIYHKGFQIPSCEHTVKYLGESQPCARWLPAGGTLVERWWPAGCPNPPSTSDLGLPPKFLGYGVNKVVFEQLRASCVDWPFYYFENHFYYQLFWNVCFSEKQKEINQKCQNITKKGTSL